MDLTSRIQAQLYHHRLRMPVMLCLSFLNSGISSSIRSDVPSTALQSCFSTCTMWTLQEQHPFVRLVNKALKKLGGTKYGRHQCHAEPPKIVALGNPNQPLLKCLSLLKSYVAAAMKRTQIKTYLFPFQFPWSPTRKHNHPPSHDITIISDIPKTKNTILKSRLLLTACCNNSLHHGLVGTVCWSF